MTQDVFMPFHEFAQFHMSLGIRGWYFLDDGSGIVLKDGTIVRPLSDAQMVEYLLNSISDKDAQS